ncbi:hypothetical protein NMY22_g9307 [Coprinellus aureogranulatus]|nr:hypothetical protein NMY22_g9307 [Coprinellus aureogranulatus]
MYLVEMRGRSGNTHFVGGVLFRSPPKMDDPHRQTRLLQQRMDFNPVRPTLRLSDTTPPSRLPELPAQQTPTSEDCNASYGHTVEDVLSTACQELTSCVDAQDSVDYDQLSIYARDCQIAPATAQYALCTEETVVHNGAAAGSRDAYSRTSMAQPPNAAMPRPSLVSLKCDMPAQRAFHGHSSISGRCRFSRHAARRREAASRNLCSLYFYRTTRATIAALVNHSTYRPPVGSGRSVQLIGLDFLCPKLMSIDDDRDQHELVPRNAHTRRFCRSFVLEPLWLQGKVNLALSPLLSATLILTTTIASLIQICVAFPID